MTAANDAGVEVNPPFFFILAWIAAQFGDPLVSIRAPSILLGTATVPLVYALGTRTVGRRAGAVAAVFVALSPFAVYYSIDARAYATLMFTTTLSTLALLAAVRRGSWGAWIAYAVSSCAVIYTHYTGIFVLAVQACWALWFHRDRWRWVVLANLAAAIGYLPWLSHFSGQNQLLFDVQTQTLGLRASTSVVTLLAGIPFLPIREVPGLLALTLVALMVVGAIAGIVLAARAGPRGRDWPAVTSAVVLLTLLAISTPVGLVVYRNFTSHELVTFPRNLSASLVYVGLALGWLLTRDMASGFRAWTAALGVAALVVLTAKTVDARYARPPFHDVASFLEARMRPADLLMPTGTPPPTLIIRANLEEYFEQRHRTRRSATADLSNRLARFRGSGRVYVTRLQSDPPPRVTPAPPRGLVPVAERSFPDDAKPWKGSPGLVVTVYARPATE